MITEFSKGPEPWVEFRSGAVEDRPASLVAGHYVAKPVELAVITPPGGNLVVEKEVDDEVKRRFGPQYEAWKKGEDAPVEGTALRDWPPVTPAQLTNLKSLHVYSVEQLAGLDGPGMQRYGIGAQALKAKAQAWLDSAESHGKAAQMVAEQEAQIEDLKAENTRLTEDLASVLSRLDVLEERPKRGRPPNS